VKNIFQAVLILLIISGCTSQRQSVSYKAGFKTIRTTDKSRIYKPGTDTTSYLHYRPVDIDIWYPSESRATDSAVQFRYLLSLLEKRAVYYTNSDAFKGITGQIAQSFCEGFKCSDTAKLLDFKTRTILNANPVAGKFPVIIYMCAYNGMGFENFRLFEEFAEKGYFVISINSIGRYPGDMTMKKEDMLEQVYDAEYSLKQVADIPGVDLSRTGIIGYSWGALSGAILAGRIPDIRYLISLDGSEFHHYGKATDENDDFNNIRASEEFRNLRLKMPYLRLESSPVIIDEKPDSVYNFAEKLSGEKQIIKIDSASHEDFSCLSEIIPASGNFRANNFFDKSVEIVKQFIAGQTFN